MNAPFSNRDSMNPFPSFVALSVNQMIKEYHVRYGTVIIDSYNEAALYQMLFPKEKQPFKGKSVQL